MEERRFYDLELDEIVTLAELREEYEALKSYGDTEAESFEEYLSNCMYWNNGTLKEL